MALRRKSHNFGFCLDTGQLIALCIRPYRILKVRNAFCTFNYFQQKCKTSFNNKFLSVINQFLAGPTHTLGEFQHCVTCTTFVLCAEGVAPSRVAFFIVRRTVLYERLAFCRVQLKALFSLTFQEFLISRKPLLREI